MVPALILYVIGVGIGVWRADGPWRTRLGLAVVWPLGPLAFVLTLALLLGASLIAFPLFGAIVALSAAVLWLAVR